MIAALATLTDLETKWEHGTLTDREHDKLIAYSSAVTR